MAMTERAPAVTRTTGAMLLIIGTLVGVLGTLAVIHFTASVGTTSKDLEDIPGYEHAHTSAGLYCTLGGVVPGMTGLHDPAYLQCVEDQTRSNLVEAGHPEAETAHSRLN